MIEVEHLTKRYGPRTAVQDVSFRVEKGEIVGFLGPNGAGKSTTLRMLTGFLAPSGGAIRIDGIDALAKPIEAKKRIGYMPEACPIYPEMRVREYLRYRAELKGVAARAIKERVEISLDQASVKEAGDRIIGQLSKGTRQRVGLADALVADPPILVLDEPTAGLDPNQIRQVRDLVRGLAGKKTVLVSTHILPEVEATCDRVVIIHRGRVVREGAPDQLRQAIAGGNVLVIEARATGDGFRTALEGVEGVRAIEGVETLGDGRVRARVAVDELGEGAERVFAAVAKAGLVLRELRPETVGSLEEVFGRLTTEEAVEPGTSTEKPEEQEAAS
ncbi:ABC transporter ATP-binding protein [Sandaracinus amylolyticus]|uniref:ABC transporter ATP-binding protein n=1 Tax=Sandaracinus amylolyticus TaxID=927083 RepID=UPI001F234F4C|nr:ABC transporter ATP-binding protein [Sandaracinus amylolyticus]UJR80963.1 ABC transporter ATP-binding component [Sandaracinus amylolyticus]